MAAVTPTGCDAPAVRSARRPGRAGLLRLPADRASACTRRSSEHDVAGYVGGTTPAQRARIRGRLRITVAPEDFDTLAGVTGGHRQVDHDEVVRLRHAHPDESLETLAHRLGCSLSTVKRHLRRERNQPSPRTIAAEAEPRRGARRGRRRHPPIRRPLAGRLGPAGPVAHRRKPSPTASNSPRRRCGSARSVLNPTGVGAAAGAGDGGLSRTSGGARRPGRRRRTRGHVVGGRLHLRRRVTDRHAAAGPAEHLDVVAAVTEGQHVGGRGCRGRPRPRPARWPC